MASLKEDLKIVISGDPSKFNAALKEAQASTKRLEAGLASAAKISGVAFAALTGTVYGLVKAFQEDEKVAKQVEQTLQTTGRSAQFTSEQLASMATELQDLTTYEDAAVASAQQAILTFDKVGTTAESFKRVTAASLDMAERLGGDASSAARTLGLALQNPEIGLTKLRKAGISFTEEQQALVIALTKSGQTAKAQEILLTQLEKSVGGAAQAAAGGTGAFKQLSNTFGNVASAIGEQLAPALIAGAKKINEFLIFVRENPKLIQFAATIVAVATAISGLVLGVTAAGTVIVQFVAIMKTVAAVFGIVKLGIAALVGATGIGLLVILLTDLALNFETRTTQIRAVWEGLVTFLSGSAAGLAEVLKGAFEFDIERVKAGMDQVAAAYAAGTAKVAAGFDAAREQEKAKEETARQERLSADQLESDQKIATLTYFLQRKNELDAQQKLLEQESRLTEMELEALQKQEHQIRLQEIENQDRAFRQNAHRAFELEKTKKQKEENQARISDEIRFGKTIAAANATFRSQEFKATQDTLNSLQTLQQSNSKTLFKIGKAAAIANAIVNVAQGVTKALSQYPPPFSFAAAAAQAAAGFVQIQTIRSQSFAAGGLVQGGIPGKDSVSAMLMPGELVVPKTNFEEVVSAVANQRTQQASAVQDITNENNAANRSTMEVIIGFTDDAFEIIERKLVERSSIGVGLI